MKKIKLTQNQYALVDDEDFEMVSKYKWYYNKGYARRVFGKRPNRKWIFMHRFIMNPIKKVFLDHINGVGIDNRKSNLRFATNSENMRNRKIHKNNTSGHKGVYWDKEKNKWRVTIKCNNKKFYFGYFTNVLDASKAYNQGAKTLFREFARLNNLPPEFSL